MSAAMISALLDHPHQAAVLALTVLATTLVGCAHDPDRLPALDRRFYDNLPTGADQQEFLRLKSSERQTFLEDKGLWSKWEALPEAERSAASQGDVQLGFHEFALYMAWGPPADTQDRDANGRPLQLHTFIRCSSGPKRGRYVRTGKGTDLAVHTPEDLRNIEHRLNTMPRRSLHWSTAHDVYHAAIAMTG